MQTTNYDKNGHLLQSTDANDVVTLNTYGLRGRLLTASVGGQTTSYTYDPVGQLTRVTLPDTSWIGHAYDAAHRRTATLDSQGTRIEVTLDDLGNVTAQSVKDRGGTLRRALGQVIDALGRVQQTTGG
jgi:YD repeat-containing protein